MNFLTICVSGWSALNAAVISRMEVVFKPDNWYMFISVTFSGILPMV